MRKFKRFLWIFIIFLIQTVILARGHILGAVPSLVLPFIICTALLEDEFGSAALICAICSAAAGALCGREFVVVALYYFYCAAGVFFLRKKPLYIKGLVKAVFWTLVMSGILEILFFALRNMTLTAEALIYDALPTAIINAIFAVIIYPLLKRTMYREEKKKLLIGDLV